MNAIRYIPVVVTKMNRLSGIAGNVLLAAPVVTIAICVGFFILPDADGLGWIIGSCVFLVFSLFWVLENGRQIMEIMRLLSRDELVIIKENDTLILYKRSAPSRAIRTDMTAICRAWISLTYINDSLSDSSVLVSDKDSGDITSKPTGWVRYPRIHPSTAVNAGLDQEILGFIGENYAWIEIGYKNNQQAK